MAYRYSRRPPTITQYGSYSPQGNFPQGEAQPAPPYGRSTQQYVRNYGRPTSLDVEGERIGSHLRAHMGSAARMGIQAALITGSLEPGFPTSGSAATAAAEGEARRQGRPTSQHSRGELQTGFIGELESGPTVRPHGTGSRGDLMSGPRVHTVGTIKGMGDGGNTNEIKTHRALGAGPSPQFAGVTSELSEVSQLWGGKVIDASSREVPFAPPSKEKGTRVRAGGKIKGILGS